MYCLYYNKYIYFQIQTNVWVAMFALKIVSTTLVAIFVTAEMALNWT